jgi:hypothetical protein
MPLTIPREYAPGLQALCALSDADVSTLAVLLGEMPDGVRRRQDLTSFVKEEVPDFHPAEIDSLIRSLHSLYQAREGSETSLDRFTLDLVDAMAASGIQGLALPEQERDRVLRNLHALLGIDSLTFLAKANALQREHENIYHEAKILTDLRPVFHSPDEPPSDMILEYTLKIVFHDGSRHHRELYMALDTDDISRLKIAIERAEKKAASLKTLLNSKGITPLPSFSEVQS